VRTKSAKKSKYRTSLAVDQLCAINLGITMFAILALVAFPSYGQFFGLRLELQPWNQYSELERWGLMGSVLLTGGILTGLEMLWLKHR